MTFINIESRAPRFGALIIAFLLPVAALSCDGAGDQSPPEPVIASVGIGFLKYTTIPRGSSVQLTAIAKAVDGTTVADPGVVWESTDTSILAVDATGRLQAIAAGVADVIVRASDKVGTKAFTVLDLEGIWQGVYSSASGPDTIKYTLTQTGSRITGSFNSIYGFPPLTNNNSGTINGELESTRFSHTIRIPATPCNLLFSPVNTYTALGDGRIALQPNGSAALSSDNCTITGTINLITLYKQQ